MTKRIRTRRPTTPGEVLREEFLTPLGLTQRQLAEHIGCDIKVINRIVNGSRVTVSMAFSLASSLDTTPEFWLNLQREVDVFNFRQEGYDLPGVLPALQKAS